MYALFVKGGPIMWPLLATSLVALSVVIERSRFLWRQRRRAQPELVTAILRAVEDGRIDDAVHMGRHARDPVAATLVRGLAGRDQSLSTALLVGASEELRPFSRGIPVLDTIVTLAPFLGLLGTVTGMIRAFGLLGERELAAPIAITGGIAEALIATAFGLAIAVLSLIPLNVLHACHERMRQSIELAATKLELLLAPTAASRTPDADPAYHA
jgi:biopolymer transport protein ExbB